MQEIDRSACGILFDYHALRELGIPTDSVPTPSPKQEPGTSDYSPTVPILSPGPDSRNPTFGSSPQHHGSTSKGLLSFLRTLKRKVNTSTAKSNVRRKETLPEQASKPVADLDEIDVLEPIYDQLVANPLWWLLQTPDWYPGEILCVSLHRTTPVPYSLEHWAMFFTDNRFPYDRPDFSGRRRFPTDEATRANQRIHRSVVIRVDSDAPGVAPYVPRARLPANWKDFLAS